MFTPSFSLSEGGSPYTATESVRSALATPPLPVPGVDDPYRHTGTFTFTVDRTAPAAPTIASVEGDSTSPAEGVATRRRRWS